MKKHELPTKKCYNKGQINSVSETSLKGYFVTHAKRYQKSLFFLRRNAYYPLWWHVVNSAFLQQAQISSFAQEIYSDLPEKFRLPSLRTDFGFGLCRHYGTSANQQDRNPAIQWRLFGNAGVETFPRSIHSAPVLETLVSRSNPPAGQIARQPQGPSVLSSSRANHPDFRYRFCGNYNLRETGRRKNRVQSQKARKTFLSPLALFRISFPGILAWQFKTGQYRFFHRGHPVYQSVFEKSTPNHCQIPHCGSEWTRDITGAG